MDRNFFRRFKGNIFSQTINMLDRKLITEDVLDKISSNYIISSKTPLYLFEYPQVVDLLISSNSLSMLRNPGVIETIKKAGLYEPVAKAIIKADYVVNEYPDYLDGYYDLITEDNKNIISFLNIKYYRYNPSFLYSDKFDPYFLNDEEIFELFSEIKDKIDPLKINFKNDQFDYFYKSALKVFPSLLKRYKEFSNGHYTIDDAIYEYIANGDIKYKDIYDSNLTDKFFERCVRYDLEGILECEKDLSARKQQTIFSVMKDDIETFVPYYEKLATLLYAKLMDGNLRTMIIESLKNRDSLPTNLWNFVYEDSELIESYIERQPELINNLTYLSSIPDDKKKTIIQKFKEADIPVTRFHYDFLEDSEFTKKVIESNPYLMTKSYSLKDYHAIAFENGYIPVYNSNTLTIDHINELLDAARMDSILYRELYSLREMYFNGNQELNDLYHEKELDILFQHALSPLTKIRIIRSGKDDSDNLFYVGGDPEYSLYMVSNYYDRLSSESLKKLDSNGYPHVYSNKNYLIEKLREDFENIKYFSYKDFDNYAEEISKIFFENYEKNFKYLGAYQELSSNPYIIAYLKYYYNISERRTKITPEAQSIYTKLIKENNIPVTRENVNFVNDIRLIESYIKDDYRIFSRNELFLYSEDTQAFIMQSILDNKDYRNASFLSFDFVISHLDECFDAFDTLSVVNILLTNIENEKASSVIEDLIESGKYVPSSEIFEKLPLHFQELIINKYPYYNEAFNYDDNPFSPNYSKYVASRRRTLEDIKVQADLQRKYLEDGHDLLTMYNLNVYNPDGSYDYDLIEKASNNNIFCVLYSLEGYDERIKSIVLDALSRVTDVKKVMDHLLYVKDFLEEFPFLKEFVINNKEYVNSSSFYNICSSKLFTPEEEYDIWKIHKYKYANLYYMSGNQYIINDLIKENPDIVKELSNTPASEKIIYDYLKNEDLSKYLTNRLFYNNRLLLKDYLKIDSDDHDFLLYNLLLRHPEYARIYNFSTIFNYAISNNLFFPYDVLNEDDHFEFTSLLEKNFNNTIRSLGSIGVKKFDYYILCEIKDNNIPLDESIAEILLSSRRIVEYYLTKDDSLITRIYPYIENNPNVYSSNIVLDALVKYNLPGKVNPLYINNEEYIVNACINDPYGIDNLENCNIKYDIIRKLQEVYLKLIEEGKYVVNKNTPDILLIHEKIYKIFKEKYPDDIRSTFIGRTEIKESQIEEAIENPLEVDNICTNNRFYPDSKVDILVSKLIEANYQITDKTPEFLLYNYKFLYYGIKNNMISDKKLIYRFATCEGLYQTRDVELFKKLYKDGLFPQGKKYILLLGEEKAFDFMLTYGKYVLCVNTENVTCATDFEYTLISQVATYSHFYDAFIRKPSILKLAKEFNCFVNCTELLESILKRGIRNKELLSSTIENGAGYPQGEIYKNDKELLELFFLKTPSDSTITDIINKYNYKLIDREIFLKRIKEYTLTDDTPDDLLEDFEFINLLSCKLENVKMVLKKHGSKVPRDYLVKAMKNGYNAPSTIIDEYLKDDLTDDIIRLAIDNNYFISNNTPDVIKNSHVYVKLIINSHPKDLLRVLDCTTVPYNMVVDSSNIDLILEAMINNYISNNSPSAIGFGLFDNNQESLNSIREDLSKLSLDDKLIKFYRILDNLKTVGYHLRSVYVKHTLIRFSRVSLEDLDKIKDFTLRVDRSNSSEIHNFASTILDNLLETDNYEKAYEEVEKIFVKNNTPTVGKLFLVFKTLHPDYSPYRNHGTCSPTIQKGSERRNDFTIFADLLKCALGSNNRSLRDYIMNMSLNIRFIEAIEDGELSFDDLMESDKEEVRLLVNHIYTMVSNTRSNRQNKQVFNPNMDMDTAIKGIRTLLADSYNGNTKFNLLDRITEMFCFSLKIHTYEELLAYAENMISSRTKESIERERTGEFDLVPGDLVKGLNSYNYVGNILQNGSVSKEFLGDCADSDATPLDTDLSVVQKAGEPSEAINGLACSSYGPLWAVIKNHGDFKITRSHLGGDFDTKYDPEKYELFHTGVWGNDHYGIRTGIPSSRIDFFMTTGYEARLGLEIAMNGFYIPVIDINTKELYFSYSDYLDLRKKLSGLSYLGSNRYAVADLQDLQTDSILENARNIDSNKAQVVKKHTAIKDRIREASSEIGYGFKEKFTGDVSGKSIELVDTGSTSRCTDLPGKADFDYICRIDRELLINESLFSKLRDNIFAKFKNCGSATYIADHKKIAITGAVIEGFEETADIEISFVSRTNKLNFSSDESLKTRLDTIKRGRIESLDGEALENSDMYYRLVVGNILEAKKLFKEHHCYKKHGSNPSEGGLGGIGIENWILQHGGSLKLASIDFLKTALKYPDYNEFKLHYHVWDFGENHYALERGEYPHDEFVYKNMDSEGFKNMVEACKKYLLSINYDMSLLETNSEEIKRVQ